MITHEVDSVLRSHEITVRVIKITDLSYEALNSCVIKASKDIGPDFWPIIVKDSVCLEYLPHIRAFLLLKWLWSAESVEGSSESSSLVSRYLNEYRGMEAYKDAQTLKKARSKAGISKAENEKAARQERIGYAFTMKNELLNQGKDSRSIASLVCVRVNNKFDTRITTRTIRKWLREADIC